MGRLRALTSAIVIVDTALFAALVPLLPHFRDEFDLSSTGAGLLVAAYAAGALIGAIPGGLVASKRGPKAAALSGLILVAVASVGIAFADSAAVLGVARLFQGLGSVFSWAGALAWLVAATPRERRGEMMGMAIGAAVFGALLGPVIGAIASVVGITPTFLGVVGASLVLVVWALRTEGAPAEPQTFATALAALQRPTFLGALWLVILPALLFGGVVVLVPLRLDDAGWSAGAISVVFLAAALVEMFVAPVLGRFSDRRGRQLPIRIALAGSIGVSIGLAFADLGVVTAILTALAGLTFGAFWAPAMALLSEAAETLGLSQGLAFGLMNAGWAVGTVIGPAAAGSLADEAGDALPFLIGAGLALATLVAVSSRSAAGTQRQRVPETP